jgi:molybdate transport system substrate-binding protein
MSLTRALVVVIVLAAIVAVVGGCPKPQDTSATGPMSAKSTKGPAAPPTPAANTEATAAGAQTKLTVLAPCGMIIPIDKVKDAFMKTRPDIAVETVYDNSVIIAKKVVDKGEPCDVFVSPGSRQLDIVRKAGKVDESTVTRVTTFELVCIVPKKNPAGISKPADLVKAKTISSPDFEVDSVGYAGRQALQKLGLWDKVSKRIVTSAHAIESHGFVASGKSQAGIAFRNCPLETNPKKLSLSKVSIAFSFPRDSYDQVDGLVAMTTDCKTPDAAKAFIAYMASPDGQKILEENGLDPITPQKSAG